MPAPAILAIDQGTTNTKVLLVAPDGRVLGRASRAMRLDHPHAGWSEQNADGIWTSVVDAIGEVLATTPDVPVAAVAISNQRETVVLWDAETGRAVGPAVSWQCRRSSPRCVALRAGGHDPLVIAKSGLAIDPMFSAGKLAWLLDSVPASRDRAAAGQLRAGTIDSWLLWRLTGGAVHATDVGNASRTQLLNLATQDWDAELAMLFDVPLTLLPRVLASDGDFGGVADGVCALPAGTPIRAVMGDSHAALYGHGIRAPGGVKVTIGTGSSVMALVEERATSRNGLSSTIAWREDGAVRHALEGNITVSGQAARFAVQLLGIADEDALTALAASVADTGGVVFVPALAGLGAPHWQDEARGTISGMTLGTRPAHVARATLEAIAHQIVDVVEAMERDTGATLPFLSVDGGATRNDMLLQMLADLSGRQVARRPDAELSAIGVAMMAAKAMGLAGDRVAAPTSNAFDPRLDAAERDRMRRRWRSAVAQAGGARAG
jgi:glycerol kinase